MLALILASLLQEAPGEVVRMPVLSPVVNNPRNTAGDFVPLKDGILMFVYARFIGTKDESELAAIYSGDGGRTWSLRYESLFPHEGGQGVQSVSLLRLAGGELALFYLKKVDGEDCRPFLRLSSEEGRHWGPPVPCIPEVGSYAVGNGRVIQLKGGRLVIPAERGGKVLCSLSDDGGKSWRLTASALEAPPRSKSGLREPAVVELKGGELALYCTTDLGFLYRATSRDGGESWSPAEPTDLPSPLSSVAVRKLPESGELLLAWNDSAGESWAPFTVALSRDEGRTWEHRKVLDAQGWHGCATIAFVGDRVVIAHGAGDSREACLSRIRMTCFDRAWLTK